MSPKKYWQLLVLFCVWIFVSYPLFGQRFIPTHDGEYHLICIHEFSKMLSAGNVIPRWAPGLNSGYGFPLFIFHYPFPNYVGSIIHSLGQPLVQSFQMSIAFGMLVAGIGCYFFLRKEVVSKYTPLIATILFYTIPYLFVDVYIRGSIGEIWGIAWAFVSLAAVAWKKNILLAVSIGFLIISHNIMAMILIPIIFGYALFFYRDRVGYLLGGIFFAAYFWIPALYESKFVVGLNSVTYSDHFPELIQLLFPSWGSNFSQPGLPANEMSQQIGIISLVIIFIASINVIKNIKKSKGLKEIYRSVYFLVVTLLSIFFLFSFSNPLWKLFSFLQYIQYPWRLLSVLLITIPILAAFTLKNTKPLAQLVIIVIALILSLSYMQPVTYEPRSDEYYLTKKEFTDGTSSLGNSFSTVWTSWKRERPKNQIEVVEGVAQITKAQTELLKDRFVLNANTPVVVRVNRLYFPGWFVSEGGAYQSIQYERDGTIMFSLPEGIHSLTVGLGTTGDRLWANIISFLSLGVILFFGILKRLYAHRN